MDESFVARVQLPLIYEKLFKTILSTLHKTSGVTIDIQNKTVICQPLSQGTSDSNYAPSKVILKEKNKILPAIAFFFFFELPPCTFKTGFYIVLPTEAFPVPFALGFKVLFFIFMWNFLKSMQSSWEKGESWLRGPELNCHLHLRDQNPQIKFMKKCSHFSVLYLFDMLNLCSATQRPSKEIHFLRIPAKLSGTEKGWANGLEKVSEVENGIWIMACE